MKIAACIALLAVSGCAMVIGPGSITQTAERHLEIEAATVESKK